MRVRVCLMVVLFGIGLWRVLVGEDLLMFKWPDCHEAFLQAFWYMNVPFMKH